jgi:hypothetical protein
MIIAFENEKLSLVSGFFEKRENMRAFCAALSMTESGITLLAAPDMKALDALFGLPGGCPRSGINLFCENADEYNAAERFFSTPLSFSFKFGIELKTRDISIFEACAGFDSRAFFDKAGKAGKGVTVKKLA